MSFGTIKVEDDGEIYELMWVSLRTDKRKPFEPQEVLEMAEEMGGKK